MAQAKVPVVTRKTLLLFLNVVNFVVSVASLIALSSILFSAWSVLASKTGFTALVQKTVDSGCLALCEGTAFVVHNAVVQLFNTTHNALDSFASAVGGTRHPDPPPNEIKRIAEAYYRANVKPSVTD